jgi:hypothetical protein
MGNQAGAARELKGELAADAGHELELAEPIEIHHQARGLGRVRANANIVDAAAPDKDAAARGRHHGLRQVHDNARRRGEGLDLRRDGAPGRELDGDAAIGACHRNPL